MFRVNNKNTRTTPLASFWYLYCSLWTYFTVCSSVSIADFEQVNAGWATIKNTRKLWPRLEQNAKKKSWSLALFFQGFTKSVNLSVNWLDLRKSHHFRCLMGFTIRLWRFVGNHKIKPVKEFAVQMKLCYLATNWSTFGHCRGGSLVHPMLITVFHYDGNLGI